VQTVKLAPCCGGTLSSLQFISDAATTAAAAGGTCCQPAGPSLLIGCSTGHVFTLSCTQHSTSPAQPVYIEYEHAAEMLVSLCLHCALSVLNTVSSTGPWPVL